MDIFDILCRQVEFAKKDENLSKHTTMGIGGSCRLLVEPFSCDEINKTIDFYITVIRSVNSSNKYTVLRMNFGSTLNIEYSCKTRITHRNRKHHYKKYRP